MTDHNSTIHILHDILCLCNELIYFVHALVMYIYFSKLKVFRLLPSVVMMGWTQLMKFMGFHVIEGNVVLLYQDVKI